MLKCLEARSGVREPSGERHSLWTIRCLGFKRGELKDLTRSRSMHSTTPPGLVCLFEFHLADLGLNCGYASKRTLREAIGNRGNLLEALADQTRPVLNGVAHEAAVDVVEFLIICPLSFHIVDLEAYIRRYPTCHSGVSEKGRDHVGKA